MGGTVSLRVRNLSDSMEFVGKHRSSENGAAEKAFLPFRPVESGAGISHSCATFYAARLGPVCRTKLSPGSVEQKTVCSFG